MFLIEVPLKKIYDKQGDFHEKATIRAYSDGTHQLLSYGQPVCEVTPKGKVYLSATFPYTKTTCRHTKEFILQHGLNISCKMKDLQKLPTKVF